MSVKFNVDTSTVSSNLSVNMLLFMLMANDNSRGLTVSFTNMTVISASLSTIDATGLLFISVIICSVNLINDVKSLRRSCSSCLMLFKSKSSILITMRRPLVELVYPFVNV